MRSSLSNDTGGQPEDGAEWLTVAELGTRRGISRRPARLISPIHMAPDRAGINRVQNCAIGGPLAVELWKPWSSPLIWARLAVVLLVLITIDAPVFALIWWLVAVILRHF